MKRIGSVIKLRKEQKKLYFELHKKVWPEIKRLIRDSHIQNYSIFYKDDFLFSYYEYTGDDYAKDMQKMANNPLAKKWWAICKPCQEPLETRKEGEWWAEMRQVFYLK